jgi:hypothetical protein
MMIFLIISLVFNFLCFFILQIIFLFFLDILKTNKTDYIDFQEVEDALRPILEEVAHNETEKKAITDLCQFVCDQLRL